MNGSHPSENTGPIPGVGAFVVHNEQVLLVRRSKPPGMGEWALPGGRIETGETLQQTAEREVLEETRIRVRAGKPLFAFDLIERDEAGAVLLHLIIIDLAADYLSGAPVAGDDALDVRWVGKEDVGTLPVHFMTMKFLRNIVSFIQ